MGHGRPLAIRDEVEARIVYSADPLLLAGSRDPARRALGLGLWEQSETRLTPRELDAHIEQGIRPAAGTRKLHDRQYTVRLSRSERHGSASAVMRAGIDAKNQIARADSVAHDTRPLSRNKPKPRPAGGKNPVPLRVGYRLRRQSRTSASRHKRPPPASADAPRPSPPNPHPPLTPHLPPPKPRRQSKNTPSGRLSCALVCPARSSRTNTVSG